jgi:hypothetical protein
MRLGGMYAEPKAAFRECAAFNASLQEPVIRDELAQLTMHRLPLAE